MYDLLLKDGQIIDPAQKIHDVGDIGIKDGKIAAVGKDIPVSEAHKAIPVNGRIIVPGLIDLHCHAAKGLRRVTVEPDNIGLHSGVSLLCEGGTAGPANFYVLKEFTMKPSRTKMFCFLNLATSGLPTYPEIRDEYDIDVELTRRVIEENRDVIRGVKLRAIQPLADGLGLSAVEIAKKLAAEVKLPLVLHIGDHRSRTENDSVDHFSREAVRLMDKGDILCHFMTWEAGGLILPNGQVQPELFEAQKRGVILDSCHGLSHFSFEIARHAIRQGILPTVISTDISGLSVRIVQSLLVTMSKFLNLGLSIDQVIEMTTINPARALGEEGQRGSLACGRDANMVVLEIVDGEHVFSDGNGMGILRGKLLEPRMVLKEGIEVPHNSCYHVPPKGPFKSGI
ncbi:MAG: amidohydrolase family protein [Chloroflexi bacterium]|nr:amidohydrolase family protein [Chloroflexota bacterium]